MNFEFKTKPYEHQLWNFKNHSGDDAHGLFWEQGTGKSWEAIQHAARLYAEGGITGVIVIAPNGVHDNWDTDELPAHCPIPYLSHAWSSARASTKTHAAAVARVIKFPRLAFLLMSYHNFMTKMGRKACDQFVASRRVLLILDESQRIKSPNAKRTKSICSFARKCDLVRIASGTPVTRAPFDVYPQMRALDWDFWKPHGFGSFLPFKTYFGIWEDRVNASTGQRFKTCVSYRNIEKLTEIIQSVTHRVLKSEALDLPSKVYHKRYFEMSPKQKKIYGELRDQMLTWLDSGEMVTAPLMIVRMLRLQQISSGYLPHDDRENVTYLDENPRLNLLTDMLEDLPHAIIFARFRHDIDQICGKLGSNAVRYDGSVSQEERKANKAAFQEGRVPYFVGNTAACSTGLTLHRTNTVIYYTNSFDLEHRMQSEDRIHRIGQHETCNYYDLICKGTLDGYITKSLREKKNVASTVIGDEIKEWI